MSKHILVVERNHRKCNCDNVSIDPDPVGNGHWLTRFFVGTGHERCPHGSVVRELRAEDIPADLAAAALGLEESDLGVLCGEVRDPTRMGRWESAAIDNMREAYEMVRTANAKSRGGSRV
jgi:hypothetical protein